MDPVLDTLRTLLVAEPTPDRPLRVVLVPCGTLGVVPWHAARLAGAPERFGLSRPLRTLDLFVTSYAASGREFLRSQRRKRQPYKERAAIVADPARLLSYAGREALALHGAYLPDARLLGFILDHPTGAAGTPEQIMALLVGGDEPRATLVHVIAHATSGTRPTRSRLALVGPDARPDGDGAHLTLADVVDAAGPDDLGSLVVLDCCETDLSQRDHDEALTLATAFVARGVADIVGSRWMVEDWTSAVCMVSFHHHLARGDTAPADALRAAQRWMLDPERERIPVLAEGLMRSRVRHPLEALSAWAPFTHQGNVRGDVRTVQGGTTP
jgi:hypothetical protein